MAAVGALLVSSGIALMATPMTASAAQDAVQVNFGQVCTVLDSGKIDVSGSQKTVEVTAPAGQLIDQYCVKAGSARHGNGGPVYVTVDPPQKTVTISYPNGKDISHYSVSYVAEPVEPQLVTPAPPTFVDPTCTTTPVVTLPTSTDVSYAQTGSAVAGGSVTVTASLVNSETTAFAKGAVTSWTHAFTTPTGCTAVSPPTTTTQVSPPKAHTTTKAKAETTTPTVVKAGLAGDTTTSSGAGLSLAVAGLLLLAGAGGLVVLEGGRRTTTA